MFFFVNKLGIKQLLIICVFAGALLGTLCSNLLKEYFTEQFFLFDESYLSRISNMQMDQLAVTGMAFIQYCKEFGLLILLATTMIGAPYLLFHCTYKGFCLGFILSTSVLRYGMKGVLFYLCYISPQCLIYIPLLVLTYLRAYRVNAELYSTVERQELHISKFIPSLLFLLLMIAIASLLEGYLNTSLLRMIMLKLV